MTREWDALRWNRLLKPIKGNSTSRSGMPLAITAPIQKTTEPGVPVIFPATEATATPTAACPMGEATRQDMGERAGSNRARPVLLFSQRSYCPVDSFFPFPPGGPLRVWRLASASALFA